MNSAASARQNPGNAVSHASEDEESIGGPTEEAPQWKEELLDTLQAIPPDAFERLCTLLLRESGFVAVKKDRQVW